MKLTDIKNTAFFIILVVIIIACFSLGIWQIDRYSQKQQQHNTPSVDVHVEAADLIHTQNNEALINKTVNINGSFITDSIIRLDNKMFESRYGVDLFSLFKEKTSNKVYLVNMGWLEVGNKREKLKQPFDFSGIHSLQAKIANIPSKPPFISKENFRDERQLDLWLFINKEYLIKQHKFPIEDLILINLEPTDQLKVRTIVKEDNSFMHIMYAIQWFLFALFALFGLTKIYK
ncbi:MAG: SURF1 family protein [Gammaproteobacteria bacterium]|nr:SURF1 family protein [Gammaproteobacteria bacterium]